MKLLSLGLDKFPIPEQQANANLDIETVMRRLEAVYATVSGIVVTPENCMQSPTIQAIVTAVTRRFASLPVTVLQKTTSNGRTKKEPLPNHPVTKLLNAPNDWQDRVAYWMDAASYLVRYGRYAAFIKRGVTGPIRALLPLHPSNVELKQDENWNVTVRVTDHGGYRELRVKDVHYARGPARDGLNGDSPITDIRETIALEIAAEKFGASFFGGSPMPGLIFKIMEGFQKFKSAEEEQAFIRDFRAAYTNKGRFTSMILPKGLEVADDVQIENDKAQFLETRKHQRTVIAGAFGVPPHLVGDLEHGTYNNVEQQSLDFTTNVILPKVRIFEAAMEADLLTDEDRNAGIIIRFNLDAVLRGDFASRQTGLKMQRESGVINANEWREAENMNPRTDPRGEEYWNEGPSGQNMKKKTEGDSQDAASNR